MKKVINLKRIINIVIISILTVYLLCLTAIISNGQTFKPIETNKQITKITQYNLDVNGVIFIAFKTNTGNNFVLKQNLKTGETYKSYFGYDTNFIYNQNKVYSDLKKTKFWFLSLTKNKTIKKVYLEMNK